MPETKLTAIVQVKDRATAALSRLGGSFSRLGLAVGAAAFAVGVKAVKDFGSFDDAMTKSLAIMGDISGTMRKDMEKAARQVGRTTKFSATQAAEAYFYLASAGLDAKQSIAAMPQVAEFATAGNFDLAKATDLLTDAQSALGLSVDDTIENLKNQTRVSDVLVKANTLANATVEQFSESLTTRAGAALKLVNKDIEEGVAVLAAWADQGVKGAEAGTRLDIVLRDLQTRAIENKEEFEKLGISVFDSEGNMKNMADIIGDLEGVMEGMSDRQKRATIQMLGFQDRSVAALLTLLGTSDAIREYEKDLRSAGGTTEEVAKKNLSSFNEQMNLLKSEIEDISISIGEKLAPKVGQLRDIIMDLLEKFRDLSPETKNFLLKITALIGIIIPAIVVFGKIAAMIGSVVVALKALVIALGIGSVIGLIILQIKTAKASFQQFKEFISKAGVAITKFVDFAKELPEKIPKFLSRVNESIKNFFLRDLPYALGYALGRFIRWIVDTNTRIGQWARSIPSRAATAGRDLVNSFINFIKTLPSKMWMWLVDTSRKIISWGKTAPSKAKSAGKNLVSGFIDTIKTLPGKLWDILVKAAKKVTEVGGMMWGNAKKMGSQLWGGFKKGMGIESPSYIEKALDNIEKKSKKTLSFLTNDFKKLGNLRTDLRIINGKERDSEVIVPANRNKVGGGFNVYIQGGTYLSREAAEDMGDLIIEKLRKNIKLSAIL